MKDLTPMDDRELIKAVRQRRTTLSGMSICIILLAMLRSAVVFSQDNRVIYVTIRVDDIFMRESPLKPQEIDGFVEVCEKHNARVMLAVIPHRLLEPQNADGTMANALRKLVDRGHMVSMHGYAHRCSICGSTGHEYDCQTRHTLIPFKRQLDELTEGRNLLEKMTGKKVSTYVSPGSDDQLNPQTAEILLKLGFTWVTDTLVQFPTFQSGLRRVPDMPEYTWDLSDSTYESSLNRAKADFRSAVGRGNYYGFALHDHFTRRAFRGGIVLRWTDEFLAFIDATPGISVKYVTIDDFDPTWFAARSREAPR